MDESNRNMKLMAEVHKLNNSKENKLNGNFSLLLLW